MSLLTNRSTTPVFGSTPRTYETAYSQLHGWVPKVAASRQQSASQSTASTPRRSAQSTDQSSSALADISIATPRIPEAAPFPLASIRRGIGGMVAEPGRRRQGYDTQWPRQKGLLPHHVAARVADNDSSRDDRFDDIMAFNVPLPLEKKHFFYTDQEVSSDPPSGGGEASGPESSSGAPSKASTLPRRGSREQAAPHGVALADKDCRAPGTPQQRLCRRAREAWAPSSPRQDGGRSLRLPMESEDLEARTVLPCKEQGRKVADGRRYYVSGRLTPRRRHGTCETLVRTLNPLDPSGMILRDYVSGVAVKGVWS